MYESFYKLRASPFQLAPDPAFFYDSNTHRQGLVRLRQLLENGAGIASVIGSPGTGKTELMNYFVNDLQSKNFVVANIPITRLRSNNILDYIAAAFGVVNMGFRGDSLWFKEELLGKIQQHLFSRVSEGEKFVVLIDNAESLSFNSLKKIVQLCVSKKQDGALVQCFLFGESSIAEKLAKLKYGELSLNVTTVKLDALGEAETRHYIEHRLIQAGWQGNPEITNSAHSLIYSISEGIPWHINLLCHRVFLQGYLEDSHQIDEKIVRFFQSEEQLQSVDVSGSDITSSSNVVKLQDTFSSRSNINETVAKSTNMSSSRSDQRTVEYVEQLEINVERDGELDTLNELPISIDDVEAAFDGTLNDEYTQNYIENSSPEDFNDPAEIASPNVTSKHSKSISKRDVLLDKIIPGSSSELRRNEQVEDTSWLNEEHGSVSQDVKEYPLIFSSEGYRRLSDTSRLSKQASRDYEEKSHLSPMQIATSASIVTSLFITLVIWVLSESRVMNTYVAQSVGNYRASETTFEESDKTVNSTTPSPFENPNDVPRTRKLMK